MNPADLHQSLAGISHVIHCAGATRARNNTEFYEVNQQGTRNVVEAVNANAAVQRLVHISSLAASGPSSPGRPRREEDAPQPVSEYGKSKLAGELEVQNSCRPDYVILRPPAVYGPRDVEFLRLFKAVKNHLCPKPCPRQELSLVFVLDLARCAVNCLDSRAVSRKTFFVACEEMLNAGLMAQEIASLMRTWTLPLPLPIFVLWLVCLGQQSQTWLTGKPNILGLQKFAELRAPGWTCGSSRLEAETGSRCPTRFREGAAQTLAWYREQHWL